MASGGFTITLAPECPVRPEYVLRASEFHAHFLELRQISNIFRGGWITCTKQYFGELPIIVASQPRHDEMVRLVEEMLAAKKEMAKALDDTDKDFWANKCTDLDAKNRQTRLRLSTDGNEIKIVKEREASCHMSLLVEISDEIQSILDTDWGYRDGNVVPEAEDVQLGNDAVLLDGTVLYADLAKSTHLVKGFKNWFAAEVYKSYLVCACKIIRNNNGEITAFDGDRVMAVFIGDSKNTSAAKTALQINYAVQQVINPKVKEVYPETNYQLRQAVGIDHEQAIRKQRPASVL